MTPELTMLACTLVLALVQILLPALLRTRETGTAYNVSARDGDGPPVGKITGRLQRAQANLFETLPLFATAVLIAHVTAQESALRPCAAPPCIWPRACCTCPCMRLACPSCARWSGACRSPAC